ncbi:MAG: hypothetical protein IJ682_05630 [Lachnospiraceae bacterium]|nr:hypothetical protein [Lachnospiraceae bacterium]
MTFVLLKKWVRRLVLILLAIGIAGLFFYGSYEGYLRRHTIDVLASLDEPVATVDGEELVLRDLGFYILFEERKVEEEAEVYNAKRTKDFWNIHTNGFFLQAQAKEAVLQLAIHDRIFYRAAQEAGLVLTSEEKERLENARTDFWADLYDEQLERIPGTFETVNETMKEIALAEKYQFRLAKALDTTYAGLNWGGYDYEQMLKNEHKVKVNKRIWRRVVLGDITLTHDDVSYINAFDEK